MNRSSRFAFLAFLDLISCAFGAAVIIFVVAAVAGEPKTGDPRPELLLIRAEHLDGGQPEIGLIVNRPGDDDPFLSTDSLDMAILNAKVFSSPAGAGSVFCTVIPNPSPGTWKFTLFRVDGASATESKYQLEAFCARADPERRPQEVLLPPWKVAGSKHLEFTVSNE